jgi:hypothetical protein
MLIAFTLFRPGFWMDMVYPPYDPVPPTQIEQAAEGTPVGEPLRLRISGVNEIGEPLEFTALLNMPEGETGAERLENAGLMFREDGDSMIIDDVAFDSPAQDAGLDWDQEVLRVLQPQWQPSKYLMFIPAFLLLALVIWAQRGRGARDEAERRKKRAATA